MLVLAIPVCTVASILVFDALRVCSRLLKMSLIAATLSSSSLFSFVQVFVARTFCVHFFMGRAIRFGNLSPYLSTIGLTPLVSLSLIFPASLYASSYKSATLSFISRLLSNAMEYSLGRASPMAD